MNLTGSDKQQYERFIRVVSTQEKAATIDFPEEKDSTLGAYAVNEVDELSGGYKNTFYVTQGSTLALMRDHVKNLVGVQEVTSSD